MGYLAELVISGLVIGAIYGLIAMAFSVIYKATGLVNFALTRAALGTFRRSPICISRPCRTGRSWCVWSRRR